MEYTKFGEELRVLRTRRHQNQKEMANVLGVTKSFLSAVEKGRHPVPGKWLDIIVEHYHLKPYPAEKIKNAIHESKSHIKIMLNGEENYKRNLAIRFEEAFNDINEENAKDIIKILMTVAGPEYSDDDPELFTNEEQNNKMEV